jgi:MFS superfamily sulfate permease-like transporter
VKNHLGNMTGAFSDGAILFPLLAALVLQAGMDGVMLLASIGAAYIAAGFVFRVPMAVQPLKSVVVSALAIGASALEISVSGLVVGVICLVLSFCYADRLASLVPKHLVHGLQLALGVLLMVKGVEWGFVDRSLLMSAGFVGLTLLILFLSARIERPVMGWVATGGLALAFFLSFGEPVASPTQKGEAFRLSVLLALVLPQLALTLTNSVVGTHDVSKHYFGESAKRVTPARLLRSIGIGNILSAGVGGLPFCHGSGGVTAHVKGGATSWHMNLIIGSALLALAGLSWLFLPLIPAYPAALMAVLVFVTGWFHVQLAGPSWEKKELRWQLVAIGLTALVTQNMLWALGIGILAGMASRVSVRAQATKKGA